MCFLPRTGDDPRGVEPGTPGLRLVSWSVRRARTREGARVRNLSRQGAGERARGPSALSGVPRPARRRAHARVRHMPQERDDRNPRGRRRRVRDLPSSTRPRRNRGAPVVRELPRAVDASGAPCRRRPRGLYQLSRRAPRACPRRPRHVHGNVPHRQTRPPAERRGMHRVPRIPALVSEPIRRCRRCAKPGQSM
jgi:hypothetical protein